MKKFILIMLIAALSAPVLAYTADDYVRGRTYFGSGNTTLDPMYLHMTEAANGFGRFGTGKTFYVDSNVTKEGNGTSWVKAKDTLDEAVALCEADRGDFIYVAQGHAETVNEADEIDLDVAGITVIGVGNGNLRPTFTYTVAAGEIVIGAANVAVHNIRCVTSVTAVLTAIDVELAGKQATIGNVDFVQGIDATLVDEFLTCVTVNSGADNATIAGCFADMGKAGATQAILISTASGAAVTGNELYGDYSVAVIKNPWTAFRMRIANNVLYNGNLIEDSGLNGQPAVELADATTGVIRGNTFASTLSSLAMCVADDMTKLGNEYQFTDGDEFESGPGYGHTDGTSPRTTVASYTSQ